MDRDDEQRWRKAKAVRLKEARIAAGFQTPADAQRAFGGKSTYTSHENGTRGLSRRAAERYARKFRVSTAWLLCLTDEKQSGVRGTPVIGQAALGVWHEAMATALEVTGGIVNVPLRSEKPDSDALFAVKVADASVNKIFARGSFAICAPMGDDSDIQALEVGAMVYVERVRKGLREKTLRRVASVNGARLTLSTHSTDPRIKQDLPYPGGNGGESVRLLGRVVGKYEDYTQA